MMPPARGARRRHQQQRGRANDSIHMLKAAIFSHQSLHPRAEKFCIFCSDAHQTTDQPASQSIHINVSIMRKSTTLFVAAALAGSVTSVAGHGAVVNPRARQSIDYLAGVNEQSCANATGDACHNGQAAFYYRFVCACVCVCVCVWCLSVFSWNEEAS